MHFAPRKENEEDIEMKFRISVIVVCLIGIGMIISVVAGFIRLDGSSLTQNDLFEQRESRFDFANWRGVVRGEYTDALTAWNIPPLNLATNGLPVRIRRYQREKHENVVICPLYKAPPFLEVITYVCDDVGSAHDSIMSFFNSMTSTYDYSSCTNDFGDRSYTLGSTAVFARNNIFVRVHSGTNTISAEAVARQIDADILQRSTMANP